MYQRKTRPKADRWQMQLGGQPHRNPAGLYKRPTRLMARVYARWHPYRRVGRKCHGVVSRAFTEGTSGPVEREEQVTRSLTTLLWSFTIALALLLLLAYVALRWGPEAVRYNQG